MLRGEPRLGPRPWAGGGSLLALPLALLLATACGPAPRAQPLDAQRAALAVARVGELEEELRRLRGRIEALELERDRLRERVERLERRLEDRLAASDGGRGSSEPPAAETRPPAPTVSRGGAAPTIGAAPSPPQSPTPPARPTPPAGSAAPGATSPAAAGRPAVPPVEGDLAARRGYVLGTIPREAILGTEPTPGGTATAPARPGQPPAQAAPAPAPQQAARTAPTGPAPGGLGAAGRWAAARELLQKGEWEAAEDALRRYVEDFPNDPNASTAAYWLGETFLVREDWQNAAATFARNYRTFGPEAPRAPDNLLKLGVALARLGDKEKACQTFAELDRRHPNASSAVRQALARERAAAGCS